MAIEFEKMYLDPGDPVRCTVCGRIVETIEEDEQEYQYRKTPKQKAPERIGLPRDADKEEKEFVFIQTDNSKNVLCRYCYHLHITAVEIK